MLHCLDYNVTKTQNRRCWLTWAKLKSKCDFINCFWVAKTQLSLWLVTTVAYQRKFHFSTTAGMRLHHHGNFKVQRFQLFEQIKKDDCAPSPAVPHLPLHICISKGNYCKVSCLGEHNTRTLNPLS